MVVNNFLSVRTWGFPSSGNSNASLSIKPKDFKYFNCVDGPNFSAIFAEPILLEWTTTSGMLIE